MTQKSYKESSYRNDFNKHGNSGLSKQLLATVLTVHFSYLHPPLYKQEKEFSWHEFFSDCRTIKFIVMNKQKNSAPAKGQQNMSDAKSSSTTGNQSAKTKSSIGDTKERGNGGRNTNAQMKK